MSDPKLKACHWKLPDGSISACARGVAGARGNRTLNLAGAKQLPDQPCQTIGASGTKRTRCPRARISGFSHRRAYCLKRWASIRSAGCPTTMWSGGRIRVAASLCHFGARRRRVRSLPTLHPKMAPTSTATSLTGHMQLSHGDQIRMCDREMVFMSRFHNTGSPRPDTAQSRLSFFRSITFYPGRVPY